MDGHKALIAEAQAWMNDGFHDTSEEGLYSEIRNGAAYVGKLITALSAAEGENKRLSEIVEQCRAQFQFYADEHAKAGKIEKANTNHRFAQMCVHVLPEASHDAR